MQSAGVAGMVDGEWAGAEGRAEMGEEGELSVGGAVAAGRWRSGVGGQTLTALEAERVESAGASLGVTRDCFTPLSTFTLS